VGQELFLESDPES